MHRQLRPDCGVATRNIGTVLQPVSKNYEWLLVGRAERRRFFESVGANCSALDDGAGSGGGGGVIVIV